MTRSPLTYPVTDEVLAALERFPRIGAALPAELGHPHQALPASHLGSTCRFASVIASDSGRERDIQASVEAEGLDVPTGKRENVKPTELMATLREEGSHHA